MESGTCTLGLAHEAHRGRSRACTHAGCAREWAANHHFQAARLEALERAGYLCARGHPSLELEVHHVQPVQGHGGYRPGCQHHQDNLEVLCPEHHRDEDRWRRRVERLVETADGHRYLVAQLTLPGIAA